MGKRGRGQKKDGKSSKRRREQYVEQQNMDDEIDAFHKNRDIVPLDVNADTNESSDDYEEPIFEDEDIDEGNDDFEEDSDDETLNRGFAAKLARQQKYLREKFGGVDEKEDVDEEEEDEKKIIWGGRKTQYYGGDNHDYELQSSDDEAPEEEEAEVLRLQREKAKTMSMEDFGIEDVDEDEIDRELTLEEIPVKPKLGERSTLSTGAEDDMGTTIEEVKKDLSALSTEEQMDIVYSSAPEVVGLLSELNNALEQLENKVNPLINKVKSGTMLPEGGLHYLEVKQLLLLAYCQAITFYLLLKSEGQPVRDHPVLARLVDIKGLVDKMKQVDGNLPSELEEFMNKNGGTEVALQSKVTDAHQLVFGAIKEVGNANHVSTDNQELTKCNNANGLGNMEGPQVRERKPKNKLSQKDEVGIQNLEMLKVRAALEEKLKQNGVISAVLPKTDNGLKYKKPINRHLATYDDFDDDALNVEMDSHGVRSSVESLGLHKISQLTTKFRKPKAISGDDDLPKRDDVGERRRKHELRVLAGAGIKSEDNSGDELGASGEDGDSEEGKDEEAGDSADDFYEQVKQTRAAKLAAKEEMYKRFSAIPSLSETVDGKRKISYQIEKNRGLTRPRKKLTKNPRKKYRTKHDKAVKRRGGQVRELKKPAGPYGGEWTGINTKISRSVRL